MNDKQSSQNNGGQKNNHNNKLQMNWGPRRIISCHLQKKNRNVKESYRTNEANFMVKWMKMNSWRQEQKSFIFRTTASHVINNFIRIK